MKVHQFQQINKVSGFGLDEIEAATQMVMILTGRTADQVEAMPTYKFNRLCKKISQAFDFKEKRIPKVIYCNGRHYKINLMIDKAGRYVETVEFSKDVIRNLHKLMATIVEPCTWFGKGKVYESKDHAKYSEDMLHCDFNVAYSCAIFFLRLYAKSMKVSQPYLIQQVPMEMRIQAEKDLGDLQKFLDGLVRQSALQNTRELN
jgi:hypothetical protein